MTHRTRLVTGLAVAIVVAGAASAVAAVGGWRAVTTHWDCAHQRQRTADRNTTQGLATVATQAGAAGQQRSLTGAATAVMRGCR